MSFILNPFIYDIILTDVTQSILTFIYNNQYAVRGNTNQTETMHLLHNTQLNVATGSNETQILQISYNMIAHPVDLSNESYKILTIIYNATQTVATSSETKMMTIPYNTEFELIT